MSHPQDLEGGKITPNLNSSMLDVMWFVYMRFCILFVYVSTFLPAHSRVNWRNWRNVSKTQTPKFHGEGVMICLSGMCFFLYLLAIVCCFLVSSSWLDDHLSVVCLLFLFVETFYTFYCICLVLDYLCFRVSVLCSPFLKFEQQNFRNELKCTSIAFCLSKYLYLLFAL